LLFGASVRAAAFSALRAGLRPWCADLFADADLRARCPAMRLPGRYPFSFFDLIDCELPGPWMYTGGLENWPNLVRRMAERRPLWGNDWAAAGSSRLPSHVSEVLRRAGLSVPAVRTADDRPPAGGRWLVKPLTGSGGAGIRFWDGSTRPAGNAYLQEFIEGESYAAVYAGDGRQARLLGVTRQLVGEPWLHAAPFHYCGSVGPLSPETVPRSALERLGTALAWGCGLRGLFGVDGEARGGAFWPVEVNPRYTASVEVLEYATGLKALAWHRKVFEAAELPTQPEVAASGCIGKAILFARNAVVFPADGPWRAVLDAPAAPDEMPAFADIPLAGTRIAAGRPVLTVFARATDPPGCLAALRRAAADIDRRLYGG
jgi:predicted ATP-grasp superfamily ATP-dependent carboligase